MLQHGAGVEQQRSKTVRCFVKHTIGQKGIGNQEHKFEVVIYDFKFSNS